MQTTETKQTTIKFIDFYSPSCGPCKMMNPVIDRSITKYQDTEVQVIKLDATEPENTDLVFKLGIRSVPTFILFKDDQEQWRRVGAQSESIIVDEIEKLR